MDRPRDNNSQSNQDDASILLHDIRRRYELIEFALQRLQQRALLRARVTNARQLGRQSHPDQELLLLEGMQEAQRSQTLLASHIDRMATQLSGTPLQSPNQDQVFRSKSSSPTNSPPAFASEKQRASPSFHRRTASHSREAGIQALFSRKRQSAVMSSGTDTAKKPRADPPFPEPQKDSGSKARLRRSTTQEPGPPVSMAVPSDHGQMSALQVLIRESLEFFESGPESLHSSNIKSHKRALHPLQVGIRCKYCSHLPLGERRKAAVSYPKSLLAVYRAAQNIASTHLLDDDEVGCPCVPAEVRDQLVRQRPQRDSSNVGVSYWVETSRALGIEEDDEALWFVDKDHTAEEKDPK